MGRRVAVVECSVPPDVRLARLKKTVEEDSQVFENGKSFQPALGQRVDYDLMNRYHGEDPCLAGCVLNSTIRQIICSFTC